MKSSDAALRGMAWPLLLASLFFADIGHAQEQPSLALNRYTPAPAGDRFFSVPDADAGGHIVPHASLTFDYAHDPLVIEYDDPDGNRVRDAVVEHQLYAHLGGAFSLWNIAKIDVSIPVALYQAGSDPSFGGDAFQSPSGAAFGDIRVGARVQLWAQEKGYFALGLGGYVWIPTGDSSEGSFTSDGSTRGLPMVMASGQISSFVYSASSGVDIRAGQDFGGTAQGSLWQFNAAAGFLFGAEEQFQVGPEVSLALSLEDVAAETTNSEVLLGGKWRFSRYFVAGLGVGTGLAGGAGTPNLRGLASLTFSPKEEKDGDGDGIIDKLDACPTVPGVPSDDARKNGCPVLDKDGDTIIDSEDACPADKGPKSSEPERNGCPDDDGDGILNKNDACPDVAGVKSDDPDKHGCPLDTDGDGIIDDEDACPEMAGVASDDPKEHGCPPDSDKDGIIDVEDACPEEPGHPSEDPKKNGCSDEDADGILKADDACPTEWGRPDEDPKKNGCPAVKVSAEKITILQKVQFAVSSSVIEEASFSLLDEIARVFKTHPEIKLVEVQGHTDSRGGRAMNVKLSQARAESVRLSLVERGISHERLTARGYGPSEAIATNKTSEGREKNRRVEFKIHETDASGTDSDKERGQ